MTLRKFEPRYSGSYNEQGEKRIQSFQQLLEKIEAHIISKEVYNKINSEIDKVNASNTQSEVLSNIHVAFPAILKILEKDLGIVKKHHYTHRWMAIGLAVFGIPIGAILSSTLGNMAFSASASGVGMAIGIAVGHAKDKQIEKAGKQLDIQKVFY
jgi:hypothetical protein